MQNRIFSTVIVSALAVTMPFVSGCDTRMGVGSNTDAALNLSNLSRTGELKVAFRASFPGRQLQATIADIHHLTITLRMNGFPDETRTLNRADLESEERASVTFASLPEGVAQVSVDVYDAANQPIGTASASAQIFAGKSSLLNLNVQLDPTYVEASPPPGNLSLHVTLQEGAVITVDPPSAVNSGYITTYAGTGASGYSGDGGPATSAALKGPRSVVVDAGGSVFVLDDFRIRKIAPDGTITTVAGDGNNGFSGDGASALLARFTTGGPLAVDRHGNLFYGDSGNHRVRKISPQGIITTVVGSGRSSLDETFVPPSPPIPYTGEGGLATSATIQQVSGMAVDAWDNLYVADYSNDRVLKISGGIISTVAGNGTAGFSGDGGAATSAQISSPTSLVVDSQGNLYFRDSMNKRIRRVDTDGLISTVVGNGSTGPSGDGGQAKDAAITFQAGENTLALNDAGELFFSEGNRVRKVAVNGIVTTVVGAAKSAPFSDNVPADTTFISQIIGLATDLGGGLYLSDFVALRVRTVRW